MIVRSPKRILAPQKGVPIILEYPRCSVVNQKTITGNGKIDWDAG